MIEEKMMLGTLPKTGKISKVQRNNSSKANTISLICMTKILWVKSS